MTISFRLAALSLIGIELCTFGSEPVFRILDAQPGTPILRNGGFEELSAGKPNHWTAARNGMSIVSEGKSGSGALGARNTSPDQWSGASQTLNLDRGKTSPLVVRGWSKAKDVSGSPDSGYSLYTDIVYSDGTTLWGRTANFPVGTHDWIQRDLVIIPEKPVKSLTLHCIFRGHTGTVFFDDVTIEEVKAEGGSVLFQGAAIAVNTDINHQLRNAREVRTRDGLRLNVGDNGTQLSDTGIAAKNLVGGFLARDVATNSGFHAFEAGQCSELGLSVKADWEARDDHIHVTGRVTDTTGRDRAITLVFTIPVEALGWAWGDDVRRSRVTDGQTDFWSGTSVPCGAAGSMSLYPLAAISSQQEGLALGLDMGKPAVYRVGYHAGIKQLYIAYDFSLVPDTVNFPQSADFEFVIFTFDPTWGFRAAVAKYMGIFAESFRSTISDQGIWMPFTDISKVEGWADFGFRFKEGNNNVAWDDTHGILTFRYTEPMTWWMRMHKSMPRTYEEALRARDQLAESGNGFVQQMAQVSRTAAMHDDSGQPALVFRNEPWCDGAVWSINPNPHLKPGNQDSSEDQLNGGTIHWNPRVKDGLYGLKSKGNLDGEYLDSLEGWVTTDLNYRRDHFAQTTVPLTFTGRDQRPVLFKGLAVFEFTRWISRDVRRMSRLMFANGVPYRFGFLCPMLDVLGTETDWVRNGIYQPSSDAQMLYWRTMSGQKPYLILMNTEYEKFTTDMVVKYFERALFYGMFPSMFSHNASEDPYWQNPKWYNRDRELFKKYQPIIKRVAEAGWQPVTHARSENAKILVERFGPDADGTNYVTVLNDSREVQTSTLSINVRQLGISTDSATECISHTQVGVPSSGIQLKLGPHQAQVFALKGTAPSKDVGRFGP